MEGILNANLQGVYQQSSTPNYKLGTKYCPEGDSGPIYRYAKAGGTALAPGKLVGTAAADTNFINKSVPYAAAIGATQIYITATAAAAAGQFNDGYAIVNDEVGEGHRYEIESHTIPSSGDMLITLKPTTPIKVALTTASQVTLRANNYTGLLVTAATLIGAVVGVCPINVTAAYYFWVLTRGETPCLSDGTPTVGSAITASTSVAGAFMANAASGTYVVGRTLEKGVNTEYTHIMLHLE